MSVRCGSKVLCQRAVPYEPYKGLTFTTIWIGVRTLKENVGRLCLLQSLSYTIDTIGFERTFDTLEEQICVTLETV